MNSKLKEFYANPFGFVDKLEPTFKGHVFNPFLKFRLNRRLAFFFAVGLGLVPWILFGFDSCIAQPLMCLYRLPGLLLGNLTFGEWAHTWTEYYGKEMHYSAFLIYGLTYWALSRHFDVKLGIEKSKNVAYAASLTFLSIAIFEFYWMYSYAIFQSQPWVTSPQLPQLRILIQNIIFLTLGFFGVLYLWLDSYVLNDKGKVAGRLYRFRFDKKALVLAGVTVSLALLWIYYPFGVERISVPLENGEVWTVSQRFPQTLYTIDVDPTDSVNAGVWFFVENNWVHGLNTLVKIMVTATVCYVGLVKEVKNGEEKI